MIPKYNLKTFRNWSELDLLTGLIYGEARGEPWSGKVAVGMTARTRVLHPGYWNWGHNWREVILAKDQFSCFREDDPNRQKIIKAKSEEESKWKECRIISKEIYLGNMVDYAKMELTHYHSRDIQPFWAKKLRLITIIGNHIFYSCF